MILRRSDSVAVDSDATPLQIHGLTVAYGEQAAVWDVDLDVERSSLTAIVGPNGAGKSTLLRAALGLVPRVAGDVYFFGQALDRMHARIAYVPQRESVDWEFPISAREVARMGVRGHARPGAGLFAARRAHETRTAERALDDVGLLELAERPIGRLSGGQQQRVFIARALASNAELFLMDEPFAGIDAQSSASIQTLLGRLRREGRSAVVVHHDIAAVRADFDHALLMNVRRIAFGPPSEALSEANLRRAYGAEPAATVH